MYSAATSLKKGLNKGSSSIKESKYDSGDFGLNLEKFKGKDGKILFGDVIEDVKQQGINMNADNRMCNIFSILNEDPGCSQSQRKITSDVFDKPLMYALVLETVGFDEFYKYCSLTAVPDNFIETMLFKFKPERPNVPYNPLTIAGALMACAVWADKNSETNQAQKFEKLIRFVSDFTWSGKITCNNVVLTDLRESSDVVKAIIYKLKAKNCLPENFDIETVLNIYYVFNAIELDTSQLSMIGITLANGGVNPMTMKRVLSSTNVRYVLASMQFFGVYNTEEDSLVGLPCSISETGAGLLILPGILSIACYSPYLSKEGISSRIFNLFKSLNRNYNFHPYELISGDPAMVNEYQECHMNCAIFNSATHGDIESLAILLGNDPIFEVRDHMKRTLLHTAAAYGHTDMCKFILSKCSELFDVKDGMDQTALDDAVHFCHSETIKYLETWKNFRSKSFSQGDIRSNRNITPKKPVK